MWKSIFGNTLIMTSPTNLVKEDDHVMLRKENNLRVFQVHRGREVYLEKMKFRLDGIIGQPYGTLFEVKDGEMVKIARHVAIEPAQNDKGIDTEKDNRHLLDQDCNQKLTQENIEQMKKDGISGDNLIGQLMANSSTFQNKTGFSQEKWVKKKKKKHLMQFTVLKPSTRLMCEMHWSKGPSRICNLRIDSLAQMLSMGNVRANSTVMVVESCLGLVTGAVLERLGGYGKVISFYHGDSPMTCNLDNYDFSEKIMDTIYNYPLELVNSLKHNANLCVKDDIDSNTAGSKDVCSTTDKTQSTESVTENAVVDIVSDMTECVKDDESESKTVAASGELEQADMEVTEGVENTENGEEVVNKIVEKAENGERVVTEVVEKTENGAEDGNKSGSKQKSKKWNKRGGKRKVKDRAEAKILRAKEIVEARRVIQEKNVDCLIVATKFHPTPIVLALAEFVAPSRQIVVFSQFKEALEDCYVHLREYKGLVSYRLTETWLREYQVLPNRTHPIIQMSGTGGYLLTSTTVVKPST